MNKLKDVKVGDVLYITTVDRMKSKDSLVYDTAEVKVVDVEYVDDEIGVTFRDDRVMIGLGYAFVNITGETKEQESMLYGKWAVLTTSKEVIPDALSSLLDMHIDLVGSEIKSHLSTIKICEYDRKKYNKWLKSIELSK